MRFCPIGLMILSSVAHAGWNFILKRSNGGPIFIGLSKLVEVVVLLPVFLIVTHLTSISLWRYWQLYTIGAALVVLNYCFLGHAYKRGDMSLVYPVSRAGSLLFLPFLALLFLHETIDVIGLTAIAVIIAGVFLMQLKSLVRVEIDSVFSRLMNPSVVFSLTAAFTASCYTLWDQHSVRILSPFVYFYAYTAIAGMSYVAFIVIKYSSAQLLSEWRVNKLSIVQVGCLNTIAYLLVLVALQSGKATYVLALRQLSIAIGAYLGWRYLDEPLPLPRKLGISCLFIGGVLVCLAR